MPNGIGRGYMLAILYLTGAVVLAAVSMFTGTSQMRFILDWYATLGMTVVMPVVGVKELGKAAQSWATRKPKPGEESG